MTDRFRVVGTMNVSFNELAEMRLERGEIDQVAGKARDHR